MTTKTIQEIDIASYNKGAKYGYNLAKKEVHNEKVKSFDEGVEEGRQEALKEELEFLEKWYSGKGTIERRIAKIKKELGRK